MSASTMIGQALKRREDPRLLTGSATYTDDVRLPGMLQAAFVRSPHAHARIRAVDAAAAREVPGVVAVLTHADLAPYWKAPLPCAWAAYPMLKNPAHWPLAKDTARHVGEAVALVIAEGRPAAEDAVERVRVSYEPLPAVVDLDAAVAPGSPRVHAELPDNVSFTFDHRTDGVEAAFARADRIVRHRLRQQRLVPNAMEPRAVVADYRRADGQLTVWSSTQIPHLLKIFAAGLLGLPEPRVRVIAPEVGGGFGSKLQVYPEEMAVMAAAMRLGRPVRWTMDRREEFLATHHGREGVMDVAAAFTAAGEMIGLRVDWLADMGAYNMLNGPYVPILGFLVLPGPYRNRELEAHIRGVFTNKVPTDAYRGAGRPEATYLLERTMDLAAAELGLDPAEVRRRNLLRREEIPFTTATGMTYDAGDYHATLDQALTAVNYHGLRREQAERRRAGGRLLGIGLSTYVEACGLAPARATAGSHYGAHLYESALVRVQQSGAVTVITGSSPHGQGHETTLAQIVADRMGIPVDEVEVLHGDTQLSPIGLGTYGSRSLVVGGMAVVQACARVQDKMRRIAAHRLECRPEDVAFGEGRLYVQGAPARGVAFAEVAATANLGSHAGMPPGLEPGLEAAAYFSPENFSFPSGTHAAVVEVDPDTGRVEILRYLAVDDVGVVINPLVAEGQVHGGVVQAIAQALFEDLPYDAAGQPLGASLMEYAVPTSMDVPAIESRFFVTPAPSNALGVKGIGETGTIAGTPAVVNAVVDALAHLGVRHIDMPLTPPRVWRAIRDAQGGRSA
jgi:carbon-monoxide dehydrogenase large subunit